MNASTPKSVLIFILVGLQLSFAGFASPEAGPRKEEPPPLPRYGLPSELSKRPFTFAGEKIPIQRKDVRNRILSQVNLLLLDARSVLGLWLTEDMRYAWIYEEVLEKEGIPKEFVLLAPILSRMKRSGDRSHQGGIWALGKACNSPQGAHMSEDDWHDDKMDVELSTRCFASQIKKMRKDLGDASWLMAVAAYMTSAKNVEDLKKAWDAKSYWNIPFGENPDVLIPRWIALWIVHRYQSTYRLNFTPPPPATFDQVTGVVLAKDLPVADIAAITGVPARVILELNPKIKPSAGVFAAKSDGKRTVHTIAAPRGKGQILVNELKKKGFLATKSGK